MAEEFQMKNIKPVAWNERIHFSCSGCGSCCREVYQSVPLESLDVYRLSQYLMKHDPKVRSIGDVLELYAEEVLLASCGFFVYVLKTVEKDNACIFLKDHRCKVQPAKPRTCRIYPLLVEPLDSGTYQYHLSTEYPHHYETDEVFKVRNWMKRYFTEEDRAALTMDFRESMEIARLLKQIPDDKKGNALFLFQYYRYLHFDLEKPFLEQQERNHKELCRQLEKLCSET